MDLFYFLILVVLAIAVDLSAHWIISDREVKRLRAESARFEAEWQKFLKEIQEAVVKKSA